MCDTVAKVFNENYAIFGKNSDRAVNEPQVVEFYKSQNYPKNSKLMCTYIEIDQVEHTNSIVLSRPTWMWGGEMGVNEFGVVIGNEAVFTKGKYGKPSLIGMDLLRLALERGNTAKEAMDVIIYLLEKYGQGGNCGYDTKFEYDNAFLIMDKNEIYKLETVGKKYAYKVSKRDSISNCLSICNDADFYSIEKCNFTNKFSNKLMTFGAQGKRRRNQTLTKPLHSLEDMMKILGSHDDDTKEFVRGSVSSVCMHAANNLTADQTTNSMIVELIGDDIKIWLTGCSLPCVSLYKPCLFKKYGLIFDNNPKNDNYWKEHEKLHRTFLFKELPSDFYKVKKEYQDKIIKLASNKFTKEIVDDSLKIDLEFDKYCLGLDLKEEKTSIVFRKFWKKKNEEFYGKN